GRTERRKDGRTDRRSEWQLPLTVDRSPLTQFRKEHYMSISFPTHRRGFLTRVAAGTAALAAGRSLTGWAAAPRAQAASNPDKWLDGLTGKHRCLFDFPAN